MNPASTGRDLQHVEIPGSDVLYGSQQPPVLDGAHRPTPLRADIPASATIVSTKYIAPACTFSDVRFTACSASRGEKSTDEQGYTVTGRTVVGKSEDEHGYTVTA